MITTTENKTIVELANNLSDSLIAKTRSNGEKFICLKDDCDPWIQEAIRNLHGGGFPNDTYYNLIERVASFIAEQDDDADLHDIEDILYELEPDCYTSDLTAWLNTSIDHVDYITQVLEEGTFNNGFDLLYNAQAKQIHEVASELLNLLNETAEAE